MPMSKTPAVAYAPIRLRRDGQAVHAEIFVYGDIGWGALGASEVAEQIIALGDLASLTVRINSYGGDAYAGLALHNVLRGLSYPTVARVDGLAASAASLIAVGCQTVQVSRAALMMIHEAYTFGDEAQAERLNAALVEAYTSRPGVDADAVRAAMAAETWLTPDEAVAMGLADEVYDPAPEDDEEEAGAEEGAPVEKEAEASAEGVKKENEEAALSARAAVRERLLALADARRSGGKPRIRVRARAAAAPTPAGPEGAHDAPTPAPAPAPAVAAVDAPMDPLAVAEAVHAAGLPLSMARALVEERATAAVVGARLDVRRAIASVVERAARLDSRVKEREAEVLSLASVEAARAKVFEILAAGHVEIDRAPRPVTGADGLPATGAHILADRELARAFYAPRPLTPTKETR